MDKPLLSICIPTYNRCEYLKNSLNSIICQKEFQNGRVEIVISDNASTDDTEKLGRDYASRFKNIRYFRNQENVHDKNFPLALSRGTGVYRKLSNDCAIYGFSSLAYMCKVIQQYTGTDIPLYWLDSKGKKLKKEIVECKDFDHFANMVSVYPTWIMPFGIWESECEDITSDLSGCELQIWQCKRIYEMVAAKGKALIINRRLFYMQEISGKDMSYGLYQVLHLNQLSVLNIYVQNGLVSKETYEMVRKDSLYRFAVFLVRGEQKYKRWNFPDKDHVRDMIMREVKAAGYWDDYLKYYNKQKIFYPLRTALKNVVLTIYCSYYRFSVKRFLK